MSTPRRCAVSRSSAPWSRRSLSPVCSRQWPACSTRRVAASPSTAGRCWASAARPPPCSAGSARRVARSSVGWRSVSPSSCSPSTPPSVPAGPPLWRPRCSSSCWLFGPAGFVPGDRRLSREHPPVTALAHDLYLLLGAYGLALPVAYAGLPVLGQGAFVAVGAFGTALLAAHGTPLGVAVLVSVALAAVAGYLGGV